MKSNMFKQNVTKIAVLAAALAGVLTASAADYYWDNASAAGFGTAGGTWEAPTLNLWSLDPTGVAAREASITTGTSDALHFGTATVGLGAGTITVSGEVSANSLTFGSASGAIILSGGTSITLDGTTPTITVNNANNTISSILAGSAGMTKEGSGMLTLSGTNTLTGTTTINAGTLRLQGAPPLNTGRTYTINEGAVMNLNGGVNFTTLAGSSTVNGAGTFRFSSGSYTRGSASANTLTLSLDADGLIDIQSGATVSTWYACFVRFTDNQAPLNVDGTINGNSPLTINAAALTGAGTINNTSTPNNTFLNIGTNDASGTFSGKINGVANLTKSGTGSQVLSGVNTYSGATTINAGRLIMSSAGALSPDTAVTVSNPGQLYFQPGAENNTYTNAMTLSGLGHVEGDNTQIGAIRLSNNITLGGTLTLPSDARVGIIGSRSATLSGQVTGSGGLDFHGVKNGNSQNCTFTLSNTGNDYGGTTTISSKDYTATVRTNTKTTLKLGASGVIPDGAGKGIVALTGADADHLTLLDLNGFNETVNGLANSAATGAMITSTGEGTAVLTVGAGDTSSSFSGVITEAGSGAILALSKTGTGTLTLSGTNSYTGGTSVSDGLLKLTHAEALASGTPVEIATTTGAKIDLDFSGTVTVKSLTVNGKLLYRNTHYTSANLPSALSGGGALYTLEGLPPGTIILVF